MSVVNKIVWGGDPDKADKQSGLTRRDIYHIQKNWKLLYADPQGTGILLFKNFIKADPEVRSHFITWKKYNDDSLFTSPEFKAHTLKVVNALNSVITTLDNPDALKPIMQKMGEVHSSQKIPKRLFYVLKDVVLSTMREAINLQPKHAASWDKLFDYLYSGILPML